MLNHKTPLTRPPVISPSDAVADEAKQSPGTEVPDRPEAAAGEAEQSPGTAVPDRPEAAAGEAEQAPGTGVRDDLEAALSEARRALASREADLSALKTSLDSAIAAYRTLAIATNPHYSEHLIAGSTVEEINASMRRADDLISKMRADLQAELSSLTVPAGAPARSEPDTSMLSPREKLIEGIKRQKK